MYMFDIETLGVESTSVILSIACIHFDPTTKPSYEELVKSAFFVKMDVKDQAENYKRTVSKDTLDWWLTQHPAIRDFSFTPSDYDVPAAEALDKFQAWAKSFEDYNTATVWARGNMDQSVLSSLETKMGRESIFPYHRWRDVRTAVDIYTGSTNGYCKVNYAGFESYQVVKHNPIHDCAFDIMMLLYGI